MLEITIFVDLLPRKLVWQKCQPKTIIHSLSKLPGTRQYLKSALPKGTTAVGLNKLGVQGLIHWTMESPQKCFVLFFGDCNKISTVEEV